jgi:hypothetical protein
MSGPFDINSLGANYFTTLQAPINTLAAGANYSPAFTSSATDISSALTQLCNLDVPPSLSRVLLAATISGMSGSQQLDVEIEVDGVVILKTPVSNEISVGSIYILGGAVALPPAGVGAVQVNNNLKIRAKRPFTSSAVLTLWYVDRG